MPYIAVPHISIGFLLYETKNMYTERDVGRLHSWLLSNEWGDYILQKSIVRKLKPLIVTKALKVYRAGVTLVEVC